MEMCCKVFSLTSCVSAADVFTVCVDACVALVRANFAEFFSGSDTGTTGGQVGPTQSAARKKARLRIVSLQKASCLMFPAMRSTEHGTCAVCSAPSRMATEVHACSVSGRTGAATTEKVRQKKNEQE